jgi:predicted ATPase/transcriptional regulator with XRE-family HTH domain
MSRASSKQPTEFGQRLVEAREARNMSQDDLAERTEAVVLARQRDGIAEATDEKGISRRAISDIETGETRKPHPSTVRVLAWTLFPDQLPEGEAEDDTEDARARRQAERAAFIRLGRAGGDSSPTPRHNLPHALTLFIGRSDDITAIRTAIAEARLVTLTGPGGCGKTRLALAAAGGVISRYADGVWLVELAALTDPTLVAQTIATVLNVREQSGRPLIETLIATLRRRRCLLILDNCEHLLAASAQFTSLLLARCAGVHILATSRQPLGVAGEYTWRVRPLAFPLEDVASAAQAATTDAVRLFVARAKLADRHFALDDDTVASVVAVCRALEGLPLLIELAAARLRTLTVADLAAQLARDLSLLDTAAPGTTPRHRAWHAAVEWSYQLLAPHEQVALRRLAVFAGGWTLTAAVAVCAAADLPASALRGAVLALADASLIQPEDDDGETRYRLLEMVRAYSRARLEETGDAQATFARLLAWGRALVEEAEPHLRGGPQQPGWLRRVTAEHDNLRGALDWALRHDPVPGIALATSAGMFWLARHPAEGRTRLERLLGSSDAATPTRAKCLYWLGFLTLWQDVPRARAILDEAAALSRAQGDRQLTATILAPLIFATQALNDRAATAGLIDEGHDLLRALRDEHLESVLAMLEGFAADYRGDIIAAQALLERALLLGRRGQVPVLVCIILAQLGLIRLVRGAPDEAIALWDALAEAAEQAAADSYRTLADLQRGWAAEEWGDDPARARRLYSAGLKAARTGQQQVNLVLAHTYLGRLLTRQGELTAAVRLLREATRLAAGLRDQYLQADAARWLWTALWQQRNRIEALIHARDGAALARQLGQPRRLITWLEGLSQAAHEQGESEAAARWLASAARGREARGLPLPPVENAVYAAHASSLRDALGEAAWGTARAVGHALPLADAIAEAVAWLDRPLSTPPGQSASPYAHARLAG